MRLIFFVPFLTVYLLLQAFIMFQSGFADTDIATIVEAIYVINLVLIVSAFLLLKAVFSIIFLDLNGAMIALRTVMELLLYLLIVVAQGSLSIIVSVFLSPIELIVKLLGNSVVTKTFEAFQKAILSAVGGVSVQLPTEKIYALIQQQTSIDPRLPLSFTTLISLGGVLGFTKVAVRRGGQTTIVVK